MAAIKSYADLEQSKKLAEILQIETADMYYDGFGRLPHGYAYTLTSPNSFEYDKPCWSLAALLSVIPNYKLSSEHNYHTCTAETPFGKETVAWFDNPVDACVAMIEKLNKLNLL